MKLRGIIALALTLICAPALAQINPGTSPLSGAKGGTNNAFMQFSGPATSIKTFTLPNATGTIGVLNAIATWTAAQSFTDGTLILLGSSSGSSTLKAPATGGGTATLFAGPDTVVGLAVAGTLTNKVFNCANNTCTVRLGSDVTGTLPKANGGLGATTLSSAIDTEFSSTQGSVLYRNGSAWVALGPGSSGQLLSTGGAAANPSWITASGTGTVTSVAAGFGISLSSSPCTATCTVSVALTGTTANSLGSDVALNNTANYFTGPSLTLGSGRFILMGTVTLNDTTGAATYYCKLWDGTTVLDSSAATSSVTNHVASISLMGTTAVAGTYSIACRDTASTSGKMLFNLTGNSKDSTLNAIQIQ